MRTFLIALAALVTGCHWDLHDKGTEPQTAQFYFPSGIVMDPDGRHAYIANGNADLKYGGGTVMMVDMLAFECTVARFPARWNADHPDATQLPVPPLPAALRRRAEQWDVVSHRPRAASSTRSIRRSSTATRAPSSCRTRRSRLATSLVPSACAAPSDTERKLFVAVRGDPSITEINVELPGGGNPRAPAALEDPGVLQCGLDAQALARRSQYNPATKTTSAPAGCDATAALIQEYTCQQQPNCLVSTQDNGKTQLPTEPFGMQIDPVNHRLLVSHLATGQISVIDTNAESVASALLSESVPFFPPDATGRHGAFALAAQHLGDPSSNWYVTSNVNPQIATFRIGEANIISPQTQFAISASFAQGGDVRDIIFDSDGNRAFISENNPPTLLVLDTRPNGTNGLPNNVISDIVDVCQTPSHMGLRKLAVAGAPGAPTQLKNKS